MSLTDDLRANHLALEPLLLDRLAAHVPAGVTVLTGAQLERLPARMQPAPCVFLLYDGEEVEDISRASPTAQPVRQFWQVVACVRNVADQAGGHDARQAAGPLVSGLLAALNGWQPSPEGRREFPPLIRVDAAPAVFDDGFFYFPLRFSARFITLGAPIP